MRALLIITAALLVALLLINVGWPVFWASGWTPPAVNAGRCWTVLCVVNQQGYTEVSWNEYAPPPPVVPNGAPYYP